MERKDFQDYVRGMPASERTVPAFSFAGTDYSPQDVLDHWDDPRYREARAAAEAQVLKLRGLASNLVSELSSDFIARRIQEKYNRGMIRDFFILPGEKVKASELVDHVRAGDRIGQMKIEAERLLIRELSRPLKPMEGPR